VSFVEKDGHKREFCYKRWRETRMAKEWANKDRYHPSHGVPESRMSLPKGKGFVRKVLAWGDERSRSRGGGLERAVIPARHGSQTGPAQGRAVRPAWLGGQTDPPHISGQFGFRGCDAGGFGSFGYDAGCRRFESGGVGFPGRSPPRDQYEFGRGHSFESQRGYESRFPFRGTRTAPVRREWFSLGGSRFDRFDRMDRSVDRHGRMDVANPIFEEMAGTSLTPLVLTPLLSRLLALTLGFELQVGGSENIWLISGVVLWPHTPVVTWRYITLGDGGQG
jgi:hypothetical protein